MESSENYNFSIFRPRNVHGRKNRNVILTMLLVWIVAVFGFQFLLRAIEKPVPEKALVTFEKLWPAVKTGRVSADDAKSFLNSLIMARGKGTLKTDEQKVLSDVISCFTGQMLTEELRATLTSTISEIESLRLMLPALKDQEFLATKKRISELSNSIVVITAPFTGIEKGTLESEIFKYTLKSDYPGTLNDKSFEGLEDIMKLYMTHNQSILTDTKFLGFPFHYFYTAVFLLILFIGLCIVYNILIEWRLKKQGVVE
ncbi:MAG: hypothetical protein A2X04_16585 [Bacteroidetes bacterium GWF2_41_9]|nr:MAG: hypothetical protein A2X04_16585 [Bacteroidetes bacterium GWF2_41_9]